MMMPGREVIDRDAKLVRHTLHFDAADAGVLKLLLQVALQLQIFVQQAAIVSLGKPSRTPWLGHAKAESVWMCLLTHYSLSPSSIVMWLVRR